MNKDIIHECIKRFESLKSERSTTESLWQEVADYEFPYRDFTATRTAGDKRTAKFFDSTALHSGMLLASALHGHLTPMQAKWFSLTAGDVSEQSGLYLEYAAKRMLSVFSSPLSQFALSIHQVYLDLVFFGTGVLKIGRKDGRKVFSALNLSDCFIEEDHMGMVVKMYYARKYNAEQMISEFGFENVHKHVQDAYERGDYRKFTVLNCVRPRDVHAGRGAVKSDKPYASYYIDVDNKHPLKEDGYDDFPYMVARFTKRTGEAYGFSPGMQAISDARMLHQISEVMLRAATKNADPPILSPVEGLVLPMRVDPSAINYYNPEHGEPTFWQNGFQPNYMDYLIKEKRADIQKAFFVDWLNLPELSRMTTVEIMRRSQDSMKNMSAMNARMESELLSPTIQRLFNMMVDDGDIETPPIELQGKDVVIEYQSPIAQAQRSVNANAVLQGLSAVAQFAQFDPSVASVVNSEVSVRDQLKNTYFFPQSYLRSPEEVEAIKAQQAEAAQSAAISQNLAGYSQAAKNTADAVTTLSGV